MNWYLKVIKDNYANFSGRARRKEFWMFVLFHIIFIVGAIILDDVLGLNFEPNESGGWIYLGYILATLIPSIAVSVRRLHDIGKSGWWVLATYIPLIGFILAIVWFVTDSEHGVNKWGKNPKGIGNTEEINQIGSKE